jgi:hypothetical protein
VTLLKNVYIITTFKSNGYFCYYCCCCLLSFVCAATKFLCWNVNFIHDFVRNEQKKKIENVSTKQIVRCSSGDGEFERHNFAQIWFYTPFRFLKVVNFRSWYAAWLLQTLAEMSWRRFCNFVVLNSGKFPSASTFVSLSSLFHSSKNAIYLH